MIIDHIGFAVSNFENSKRFYTTILAPLDIEFVMEDQGWGGFGRDDKAEFWIGEDKTVHQPMHIAFVAQNRDQVNQFYTAAIAAGAQDNGKPGVREIYHPNYYGAFVIDPDGHNIEAVCHQAPMRS